MITLQNAIGGTIRELRHDRKMTLRKLSSKSHIALSHLSDIERGRKNPPPPTLESIAGGLSLTATELIGEIYNYLKENN
jgi:transcriptional regulator with XRE-family HTH domain